MLHTRSHLCAVKSAPGAGLETPVYLVWPQAPLHGCCMDVAWMLHGCCMNVAWMLHGCCMDVAGMPASTRMRRGEGEAQGQQQHPRAGLYLPPSSPLSPTHTISISHLCERACGDVWRTRRICSGEFIRQGAPKSPQQPAQRINSQRENSQRGGRPGGRDAARGARLLSPLHLRDLGCAGSGRALLSTASLRNGRADISMPIDPSFEVELSLAHLPGMPAAGTDCRVEGRVRPPGSGCRHPAGVVGCRRPAGVVVPLCPPHPIARRNTGVPWRQCTAP